MNKNIKKDTAQFGFLKYYQIILSQAVGKAWDKFGALGTLIGIVLPIIAVYITKHPQSLADFLGSDAVITAELMIGLFAFVLMIFIVREPVMLYNEEIAEKQELNNQINLMLETRPNISIGKFNNEITPIEVIAKTSEGTIIPTGRKEIVERFYVEFINSKKSNVKTENADGVYVRIDFFDSQRLVATHDKPRWWGPIDMFDQRDWYREKTIKANGQPEKLYLVIRKIREEKLYIFGLESHTSVNFIVPTLELKGNIHYIHIKLSATNFDTSNYWIKMENKGKEQPIFTLINEPPVNIKGLQND